MESLTSNDIHFFVALMASEDSSALELETEFKPWKVKREQVQKILAGLIRDGTIGVTELKDDVFTDFSTDDALSIIKDWYTFVGSPFQIFLTDPGYKRWETDDWGITTKRAHFLMFSNKGGAVSA